MPIPAEVYALLGTIVGGGIGFAGTYLTQRNQWRLEREKIWAVRLAQIATDLAAVAHSVCWVTWSATHDWVDEKLLDDYNKEIHQILPKIIGSHIALAAVDEALGRLTEKLVVDAHEVDEKIGIACVAFEKNNAEGVRQLKELNKDARALDDEIFTKLPAMARMTKRK